MGGANFERPGFTEMMDAVENGAVKTVVTKDLSRLGRNYLQVGLFTEITFPKKGVRFIAINDGVDSAQGDNDMSALKICLTSGFCAIQAGRSRPYSNRKE